MGNNNNKISFGQPKIVVAKTEQNKTETASEIIEAENETDESEEGMDEGEETQPFTVVRVSSSVSQIRPNVQQISRNVSTTSKPSKDVVPTLSFGGPKPTKTPQITTTTTPSTTSKPPKSRGRPPFLRPIAKFTDIKISALENIGKKKQNKQNNNAPVDDTDKD